MIIRGEDGVTHINVYSKAKTDIGMWLSNFAYSPVELPDHGHFDSLEGYWYWLHCGDDRLRTLSGFAAKQVGREVMLSINNPPDDFEDRFKVALDIKLKTYLDRAKEICEINLPMCHYYEYEGKRKDAGYEWIIEHLEMRREMLREYFKGQEPPEEQQMSLDL